MATVNLSVSPREGAGKGVARKLRAARRVPAVLYGGGTSPQVISFDERDFRKALATRAGERVILNLQFAAGSDQVAMIREIQRHPVGGEFLHADLLAIQMDQPIVVHVPLHGVGVPYGVKNQGGLLEWLRHDLTIRVLPTQIPDRIDIDVSELHTGQSLHASDVKAEGYAIVDDPGVSLCTVISTAALAAAETAAEAAAAAAAAPAEGAAAGEGAAPAEGAAAPAGKGAPAAKGAAPAGKDAESAKGAKETKDSKGKKG